MLEKYCKCMVCTRSWLEFLNPLGPHCSCCYGCIKAGKDFASIHMIKDAIKLREKMINLSKTSITSI